MQYNKVVDEMGPRLGGYLPQMTDLVIYHLLHCYWQTKGIKSSGASQSDM